MVKRILLLTLCLLAGCTRTEEHPLPQPIPTQEAISDWAKLQLAIALTESHFDPNAIGSNGDKGIFQIRDIYIAEVNRLAGTSYTPEDAFDIGKSLEMFALMQEYKNPAHNLERAIYYHNKSTAYKRKVMENFALIERYETLREMLYGCE